MTETMPRWTDYLDVDELVPDDRNPKRHDADGLDESLKRFGYTEQVMVDERTGKLVAGHGRRELVLRARASGDAPPDGIVVGEDGRWLIPVSRGWSSKDDDEAYAYLIASNRWVETGGWDSELLAAGLKALEETEAGLYGVGFAHDDIDALLAVTSAPEDNTGGAGGSGDRTRTSIWEPDPPAPRAEPVTVQLLAGDCLDLLRELPDNSIDAVVSDPPYGLEFMGKDWDTFRIDDRSARWAGDDRTGGAGAGFGENLDPDNPRAPFAGLPAFGKRRTTSTCRTCGKRDAFRNPHKCDEAGNADWITIPVDVVPIEMRAFQNWVTQWAEELYRILKPGGHVLAFGGTRTYHRLASGLEDAGFDVRDSLHWMYGNGFPKSLDIAKEIDKRAGIHRGQAGEKVSENVAMANSNYERTDKGDAVTDDAKRWEGWGTALKPAHEPIILARKYLDQTTVDTVLHFGTGALNIDGTRVDTRDAPQVQGAYEGSLVDVVGAREGGKVYDDGRWPANILLTHANGCDAEACEEGCPVAYLDAQAGGHSENPAGQFGTVKGPSGQIFSDLHQEGQPVKGYGDEGGASRFFPTFTYGEDDAGMPVFMYVPKASTAERNTGTEGLPAREVNDTLEPGDPGYDNPRAGAGRGGAQPNFHPCLHPEEMVLTDEGWRPISKINIGDRVYGHDGTFREVSDAFGSEFSGDLVVVRSSAMPGATRATPNHPFLIYRPERQGFSIVGGEVRWCRADELARGDYALTPIAPPGVEAVDPEWAWAFGLYLAEGCLQRAGHGSNRYPSFTLHEDETEFVARLRRVFPHVKVAVYEKAHSRAMQVLVFNSEAGEAFDRLGGHGATSKRIHPDVLHWDEQARAAVLQGYLDGDGCIIKGEWRAKTSSADLAATISLLAESVGHHVSSYEYASATGSTVIEGRTVTARPYWQLTFGGQAKRRRPKVIEHDGTRYTMRHIQHVGREFYEGLVWNLTVDDAHTFQTYAGMSHNTVKPVALMRWLVRLVCPPGGTVLDPFTGSGTTLVAAVLEGVNAIGCEKTADYIPIAEARVAWAQSRAAAVTDPALAEEIMQTAG